MAHGRAYVRRVLCRDHRGTEGRKTRMTTEENKELVRRMVEVVNTGNLAVLDEIISPDYVNHPNEGEPATAQIPGQEAAKEFVRWLRRAFPDIQITVEDPIAEGDKVV